MRRNAADRERYRKNREKARAANREWRRKRRANHDDAKGANDDLWAGKEMPHGTAD